jgi:DNA replication protein DnaC
MVNIIVFPIKKHLEDFDRSKYIIDLRKKFIDIETLQFIENKENIILIGASGAGKTHYSIGLGVKACLHGKSVLFTSVPNLIIELKEAMSMSQLTSYKRKFATYDLVILDELWCYKENYFYKQLYLGMKFISCIKAKIF